ncbi:hypothetical protein AGMMS49938_14250 [Fibrobacterales bacterium]|nr:hypothetical protein AGMMS49938_14250 [Fibrobacterales bacterium]
MVVTFSLLSITVMCYSQEAIPDTLNFASPDSSLGANPQIWSVEANSNSPLLDTLNISDIDTTSAPDTTIKRGLHFFISAGTQFINFTDRDKFQSQLDAKFTQDSIDYLADISDTSNAALRVLPQKQNFQKVNLSFPLTAGIFWQFNDFHSVALGASFLYDKESVVLSDKFGQISNLHYTMQAFPAFVEYRLQISPNLISLANGDYFSLFFRYYWLLPHTEIYSTWGKISAKFDPLGNGYGIFLGYRFWEWNTLSFWGELGYSSISAESNDLLFGETSAWNLGGISISLRAMF